jgi:cyclophilin family peptidyl-prolyl cis-trans isomerase
MAPTLPAQVGEHREDAPVIPAGRAHKGARHLYLAAMRRLAGVLAAVLFACCSSASAATGPTVRFTTSLGNIDVVMLPDDAPNSVANFLSYVDEGAYTNSLIHRSVSNFIVQGGGYTFADGATNAIAEHAPVANEFKDKNLRGTLAMAKIPADPNSATSQWFFNTADNPDLDTQNSGFTVFGKVADNASLAVMDAINDLATVNRGSPFDQLPVRDYSSGDVTAANLVYVTSVRRLNAYELPTPTPTTSVLGTPTVTPTPFALTKKAVTAKAVAPNAKVVKVSVTGLPAKTQVAATLKIGRYTLKASLTASGTAKLRFKVKKAARKVLRMTTKKLKLTVKATPPGDKPSTVTLRVPLRG